MSETTNEATREHRSLDGLVGLWTNGLFTIKWQDEDVVNVTKHWSTFDEEALVDGGDFETILESLFVGARISRKPNSEKDGKRPSNTATESED